MLRTNIEVSETYRSVTRPLIYASLRKWLDYFKINNDVLVYYNGEAEISDLLGTNFRDKKGADLLTDIHFDNRLFVEVEFEDAGYNDELDSGNKYNTAPSFWFDPITKTRLSPVYFNKKIVVTINRYFKDRMEGVNYRNRINSLLNKPFNNLFSSKVHYPLDDSIILFFCEIYNKLKNVGKIPDGLTELEWIRKNSQIPHDLIANYIGNNATYVFKQELCENGLLYDHTSLSKNLAKGKYQGQYLASFTYSFYYAEHVEWDLQYPIMVYQQMLDTDYIPTVFNENVDEYVNRLFYEAKAISMMSDYRRNRAPFCFVFPIEDNHIVPDDALLISNVQRLALVDDVEEQVVLNIFKFSEMDAFWDPTFEHYIRKFNNKLTIRHRNPMHIKLWADDKAVLEKEINLNEDGDLSLLRKPNMEKEHRIVFYLDTDISNYDDECIKDIIEDEDYGRWVIDKVKPELPLPGDEDYNGNKRPGDQPWIDWDKDIAEKVETGKERVSDYRRTVHTLYHGIIAKNERDYDRSPFVNIAQNNSRLGYLKRKSPWQKQ